VNLLGSSTTGFVNYVYSGSEKTAAGRRTAPSARARCYWTVSGTLKLLVPPVELVVVTPMV
jgi:hypothetical protein